MRRSYALGFWGSKFNQIVSHRQVPNAPGPMPPQSLGHAMEDTYILLPNAVSCNFWVCAGYAPNRKNSTAHPAGSRLPQKSHQEGFQYCSSELS